MIELNDVHFSYDKVPVLNGISLKIAKGEIVAIVGANGSGKTTLLKHINGILKPGSGSVIVFGMDTRKVKVSELSRRVGLVLQNPDYQLFAGSVAEEVSFALKNFGFSKDEIDARVKKVLDEFGLYELRNRPPLSLSGGEKKRLCIATVMAWEPDVVMLDEPTVGQDARNRKNLLEIIKRLAATGKIVIIATHDLEFLWPINPRTVVIYRGRALIDRAMHEIDFHDESFLSANLIAPQLAELAHYMGFSKVPHDENMAVEMIRHWQGA